MVSSILERPLALGGALVAILIPYFGQDFPQSDRFLSVSETIGLVHVNYTDSPSRHLYRRANRESAPAIRRMLGQLEKPGLHPNAWVVLGYIGDGSDVATIEARLKGYQGVLRGVAPDEVRGLFDALGHMCARGIPEASAFMDRIQEPRFWREETHFRWFEKPQPQRGPDEYESIYNLMLAYAIGGATDVEARAQHVLDGIEDAELRRRFSIAIAPEKLRALAEQARAAENHAPTAEELQYLASRAPAGLDNTPGPPFRGDGKDH